MAAPKKEINLLPQEDWEKKPIGRIIKWALTVGRYIIIITELIVIIAFISRFKLDRDISDIYEEIQIKQARIKATESFEEEFRQTQKRLKTVKELHETKTNPIDSLNRLTPLIPLSVFLENLELRKDIILINGHSLSESGLANLINNLNKSPYFTNIQIDSIIKGTDPEISFKLQLALKNT